MFASFVNRGAPWNRNCSRGKRQRSGPHTPDAFRLRSSTRTFGGSANLARSEATLNWYRALPDDLSYPAGRVVVPTLYVWGTEDRALGREAALLTGGLVDAPYRFEILEGASHWLPEEAPNRIIPMLLDHLAAAPVA